MRMFARLLGGVPLAACLCAAQAAPLPVYSMIVDGLFNIDPAHRVSLADFGSAHLSAGGQNTLDFAGTGTPAPSLRADAEVGPDTIPSVFGRISGLLFYAFEVLGPVGTVPVRIDVLGSAVGTASAGASFAVESRWDLLDGSVSIAGDDLRSGQLTGSFDQAFARTADVSLQTNRIYAVFMLADSAAAATQEGSRATAAAFIDPTFSLGAGLDPALYSLQFSDGIGNAAAGVTVPEPGTLALALLALLGLPAWTGRRAARAAAVRVDRGVAATFRWAPVSSMGRYAEFARSGSSRSIGYARP